MIELMLNNIEYVAVGLIAILSLILWLFKVITFNQVKDIVIKAWREFCVNNGLNDPKEVTPELANMFGNYVSEKLTPDKLNKVINTGIKANNNKKKPTFYDQITAGAIDIITRSASTSLIGLATKQINKIF